jgi:hypothetical protein
MNDEYKEDDNPGEEIGRVRIEGSDSDPLQAPIFCIECGESLLITRCNGVAGNVCERCVNSRSQFIKFTYIPKLVEAAKKRDQDLAVVNLVRARKGLPAITEWKK